MEHHLNREIKLTNLALLPYAHNIVIKDITQKSALIRLMQRLLEHFQRALDLFSDQELHQFDAQVGDTLCQIRAYKLYCLSAYSKSHMDSLVKELKEGTAQARQQLTLHAMRFEKYLKVHKSQRPEEIKAPQTLIEFFDALDAVFSISEEALFLFLSYFLCHYHVVDSEHIPIAIDNDAISIALELSKTLSKKLGHGYQKKLSELSCVFMFQLLAELPDNTDLKTILPVLQKPSDEGRTVLPCYCVTEIIIRHMMERQAQVLLLIDVVNQEHKERLALLFQGEKHSRLYKRQSSLPQKETPCLVLYGISRPVQKVDVDALIDRLTFVGIEQLVLSNNAAHPQYSGVALQDYRDNPYETLLNAHNDTLIEAERHIALKRALQINQHKQLAKTLGCTSLDSSLFFLKHIFCSTFESYQELVRVEATTLPSCITMLLAQNILSPQLQFLIQ